jgi:hypothetical protein
MSVENGNPQPSRDAAPAAGRKNSLCIASPRVENQLLGLLAYACSVLSGEIAEAAMQAPPGIKYGVED